MDAKALVVEGTDKVIAMACGKCGLVHSPLLYMATPERAMEAARQAAEKCCAPNLCTHCGATVERKHWTRCNACVQRKDDEKEAARRAAATVVPQSESVGMLYDMQGDRWFQDAEEAWDHGDVEYAYASTPRPLSMNAESIVESALEDHFDEAYEHLPDGAIERLQAFLDEWCAATGIVTYDPDESRVVEFAVGTREGE